jgi:hypothetical protein
MARKGKLGVSFADFSTRKIREAARQSLEEAAATTVRALQEAGPYWDGYFTNAWEVREGNVEIPATTQGQRPSSRAPQGEPVFTDPVVPRADLRRGYSIGNSMEYRDVAMDLVPGGHGVYRGDLPGATAPRDWFTNLMEGGELGDRIDDRIRQTVRRELG